MAIGLDVIAVIVFFAAVGILLIFDRKNIEFSYGLVIRRWKRGQYVMDKWIFSHRKFLEIFGAVGVVLGFAAAVFGIGSIIYAVTLNQQAVQPILPTVGDFKYPSQILGVPFWFWIVSIFVVLTVHEPMHAIFARLAGVPVKSWGVMTLLVLPLGAFVDPDMKKVQKLKLSQKLKIFAGGSLGNFVAAAPVALAVFLMGISLFGPAIPGTPSYEAGVEGKVLSINEIEMKNAGDAEKILVSLQQTPVGSEIEVVTDKGNYLVTSIARPDGKEGSYVGVSFSQKFLLPQYSQWKDFVFTVFQLLSWLLIFNIGIGIFNMLPMKPFDGGHMFEALFAKIFKSEAMGRNAIHVTSVVVLALILFNVFGTNLIKDLL